jgi:hypothetical protein
VPRSNTQFSQYDNITIMRSFIANNICSTECVSGCIREDNLHARMTVISLHMGKNESILVNLHNCQH